MPERAQILVLLGLLHLHLPGRHLRHTALSGDRLHLSVELRSKPADRTAAGEAAAGEHERSCGWRQSIRSAECHATESRTAEPAEPTETEARQLRQSTAPAR